MNILTKQFIDIVFDKGDYTCMGPHWQNKTFPVTELLHERQEYVSINALKARTTRRIVNVTKLRTFLFEMDSDIHGNSIAMKEQIRLIMGAGMPWSTMTSSASKSVHFLLSLEEPLADRPIYTAYFEAIRHALLKLGIKVDQACKEPSRFTRAPFGVNTKREVIEKKPLEEDRIQKVLKTNRRISIKEIDMWLESHDIRVDDYLVIPTARTITDGQTSNAAASWKFDVVAKNFMRNDVYEQGNKNSYQYKMAWFLYGCGCTKDEIEQVFNEKFDQIDHRDPIGNAAKATVKCNPIYISTEEEQKQYYKNMEAEANREHLRGSYERDLPADIQAQIENENINLYETIGTEYYKVNPVDRTLISWSKTMFEKLYGSNNIPPRSYNLKGYKPDYLSEVFPVELALDRKTRNMFMRPKWVRRPGDWSTIREALKHGFGPQYEKALIYCAILICFPEAKLPLLWFIGPEDKGKSAVVHIFKALVGLHNTKKVSNTQIESDFDNFLAETQLVVVEEAGGWKDTVSTINKIKDWVTEMMTVTVNPKYGKQYDTPIHAKFIFTSNNWEAVPATGQATRFWVIEVMNEPVNKVANYYERVEQEMGHFVDYLIEEIVPTLKLDPKDSTKLDTTNRLYFKPSEYETDAKRFVKSLNKGPIHEAVMEQVSDFFEKWPEETECYFDMKSIKQACNWKYKGDPNNSQIKVYMKEEWNLEPSNMLSRPDSLRWGDNRADEQPKRTTSWYTLTRDQVIGSAVFELSGVKVY